MSDHYAAAERKFAVGDTVIYVPRRGEPETMTIAKVGRKYVYLDSDLWFIQGKQFRIDTGAEFSKYPSGDCIYTPARWEEKRHRDVLFTRLNEYRRTLEYPYRLSTSTLESLLAVLDGARDE